MDELRDALTEFDRDDAIGAIVLLGSEKAFAAGADVSAIKDWSYMEVYKINFITRNWESLRSIRKPVIAAIASVALGGGCELAMMCDIVIAAWAFSATGRGEGNISTSTAAVLATISFSKSYSRWTPRCVWRAKRSGKDGVAGAGSSRAETGSFGCGLIPNRPAECATCPHT
jgi:hypothetical protein